MKLFIFDAYFVSHDSAAFRRDKNIFIGPKHGRYGEPTRRAGDTDDEKPAAVITGLRAASSGRGRAKSAATTPARTSKLIEITLARFDKGASRDDAAIEITSRRSAGAPYVTSRPLMMIGAPRSVQKPLLCHMSMARRARITIEIFYAAATARQES